MTPKRYLLTFDDAKRYVSFMKTFVYYNNDKMNYYRFFLGYKKDNFVIIIFHNLIIIIKYDKL